MTDEEFKQTIFYYDIVNDKNFRVFGRCKAKDFRK